MQSYKATKQKELETQLTLHANGECYIDSCELCQVEWSNEVEDIENINYKLHLLRHRQLISYPEFTKKYCRFCREESAVLGYMKKPIL
jgi:hypothetical protein